MRQRCVKTARRFNRQIQYTVYRCGLPYKRLATLDIQNIEDLCKKVGLIICNTGVVKFDAVDAILYRYMLMQYRCRPRRYAN